MNPYFCTSGSLGIIRIRQFRGSGGRFGGSEQQLEGKLGFQPYFITCFSCFQWYRSDFRGIYYAFSAFSMVRERFQEYLSRVFAVFNGTGALFHVFNGTGTLLEAFITCLRRFQWYRSTFSCFQWYQSTFSRFRWYQSDFRVFIMRFRWYQSTFKGVYYVFSPFWSRFRTFQSYL